LPEADLPVTAFPVRVPACGFGDRDAIRISGRGGGKARTDVNDWYASLPRGALPTRLNDLDRGNMRDA